MGIVNFMAIGIEVYVDVHDFTSHVEKMYNFLKLSFLLLGIDQTNNVMLRTYYLVSCKCEIRFLADGAN